MKEKIAAVNSAQLKQILSTPIYGTMAIAHVRNATVGTVTVENAHPFAGEDISGIQWILAHNGSILEKSPIDEFKESAAGETDSERILLYLIAEMNAAIAQKSVHIHSSQTLLTMHERAEVIEKMTVLLSRNNKLNLMISDGEYLYIHVNMKNTLFTYWRDGIRIFSTTPLNRFTHSWEPVPLQKLLVYQAGQLKYTGKNQSSEYISPMLLIDMNYAI
jgi:glutamine amidotransferase